jgi:hypothetical protein
MLCAGVEMERCEVGILRQACDPDAKSGVSWHSHCTGYREAQGSTVQHGCNVLKMHENARKLDRIQVDSGVMLLYVALGRQIVPGILRTTRPGRWHWKV